MKKGFVSKVVSGVFVGTFVLALVVICLVWLGASFSREAELRKQTTSQAVETKSPFDFGSATDRVRRVVGERKTQHVLRPGHQPVRIETNGRSFRWEHYQIGTEGSPVLLIRFILVNGEVTAWENIWGQHLKKWQLPDHRSIKAVEFGVPKEGSTEGLEVEITS